MWLLFFSGLALLIVGADILVKGASRLASALGISPLIIGLTVVAFGTSTPELAVSIQASMAGQADIAVGNVVGSNIFNVLLILGVSAVFAPLVVSRQLIRLDVPLMIGVSLLMGVMALDGRISRLDGAVLAGGIVAYTLFLIRLARKEPREAGESEAGARTLRQNAGAHVTNVVLVLAGLGLLVLGARWLVSASIEIARLLGVSELVIGLTIVAGGTSLPEVATSIMATVRGERDIAVGNVVGSNIYNILAVLGFTALVSPSGVGVATGVLDFDLPVMIAVAFACLPIFATGHLIARWEGFLFLGYFVAYTLYVFLQSAQHDALPAFSAVMMEFVIPLTVVTLAVISYRAWRAKNRRQATGDREKNRRQATGDRRQGQGE